MAKIYSKSSELNLILGTREGLLYPFTAPSWTDLRLSAWVSLTKAASDDDNTGLAETLTRSTSRDDLFFGFKDNSGTFPRVAGSQFAGIASNTPNRTLTDVGSGTSWRMDANQLAYLFQGTSVNSFEAAGHLIDLPGTTLNSSTYAQFWSAKITRSTGSSLTVTPARYFDINTTSTPTIAGLRTLASSVTYTSAGAGAFTSTVPTCVFIYWPYNNSRLRINAL